MNSVFKALADPTRRRVLQLLRSGPMSAGELSDQFSVSKPTMSAHFSVLQKADLIEAQKDGRTILYRLKLSVLEDALLTFVQTVGAHTAAKSRAHRPPRAGSTAHRTLRGTT